MKLLSDQISEPELGVVLSWLNKALANASGDVVEFGCYVGTTSVLMQPIIQKYSRQFHVYDSFEGLPEKSAADASPAGQNFKAGELATSKKELVRNFKKASLPLPVIHKAWFNDLSSSDLPGEIAFAFLDGDYYNSILDSLKLVWPRLADAGYVAVHDYERQTLPGVKRAIQHFLASKTDARLIRHEQYVAILCRQPSRAPRSIAA